MKWFDICSYAALVLMTTMAVMSNWFRAEGAETWRRVRVALTAVGLLGLVTGLTGGVIANRERRAADERTRLQGERDTALLVQLHDQIVVQHREVSDEILRQLDDRVAAVEVGRERVAPVTPSARSADTCETPPRFRPGAHQLRIATSRTPQRARAQWSAMMRVLTASQASEWKPYVQRPVTANIGPTVVHMVAVNDVDASAGADICDWLQRCEAWDSGLLPCEVRRPDG